MSDNFLRRSHRPTKDAPRLPSSFNNAPNRPPRRVVLCAPQLNVVELDQLRERVRLAAAVKQRRDAALKPTSTDRRLTIVDVRAAIMSSFIAEHDRANGHL
jgi:hypothetical protein